MDLTVVDNKTGCGCGNGAKGDCAGVSVEGFDADARVPGWVQGTIATAAGIVPRVATRLRPADIIGSWKARWGAGRMHYLVKPGLYAAGAPGADSPVLVSANYKMSFDRLRRELEGIDAWVLVLDTKGINVWCAAGKGTFGTEELTARIGRVRLSEVVTHRTLILPQLSAAGVAAHLVRQRTGFRVVYGPVRAADLPAFLKAGNKATPGMRQVRFGFLDRLVLTPMELVATIKPALILVALLFLLRLAAAPFAPFLSLVKGAFSGFAPFLGAILAGALFTPALLPYIPGRAFAWKGWLLGFVWTVLYIIFASAAIDWRQGLFYFLVLPPVSAYLAMNFTGASTYTSLSGVVREMKTAVPALIVSAGSGVLFLAGVMLGRVTGII